MSNVYVQSTATGFQWGFTTSNMVALSTNLSQTSSSPVTFTFLRHGTTSFYYKLPPGSATGKELPTSNGPSVIVNPDSSASISFSQTSGGTYYTGSVTVSSDDFFGGGGNDS